MTCYRISVLKNFHRKSESGPTIKIFYRGIGTLLTLHLLLINFHSIDDMKIISLSFCPLVTMTQRRKPVTVTQFKIFPLCIGGGQDYNFYARD